MIRQQRESRRCRRLPKAMRSLVLGLALPLLVAAPASAGRAALGPATASPKAVIIKFYGAIDEWNFGNAYNLIDPYGRPGPFRYWVENGTDTLGGYLTTASVTIRTLNDSTHRVRLRSGRYACIGAAFVAHHTNGQSTKYGGWYMTRYTRSRHWRILYPGSHLAVDGRAVTPSKTRCAAAVPKKLR